MHLGCLVKCKINNILSQVSDPLLVWLWRYNISRSGGVQLKRLVQVSDEYPYLRAARLTSHMQFCTFFSSCVPVSSWQNIDARYKYRAASVPPDAHCFIILITELWGDWVRYQYQQLSSMIIHGTGLCNLENIKNNKNIFNFKVFTSALSNYQNMMEKINNLNIW